MKNVIAKILVTTFVIFSANVSANEIVKVEKVDNKEEIQAQVKVDIADSIKSMQLSINLDVPQADNLIAKQSGKKVDNEQAQLKEFIAE